MLYEVITVRDTLNELRNDSSLMSSGRSSALGISASKSTGTTIILLFLRALARITSYNVCYTKLLRQIWKVQHILPLEKVVVVFYRM